MRELANQRHELFAQFVAAGKTASAAYHMAGYRPDRHHAARLATKGHIRARVAFLQAQASQGAVVTLDSLISEAEAARQLAMRLGQCSAAIAAIKEIGILTGLRIQRSERLQRNINDLTDDELIAIAQGESSTIELEAGEVSWSTQRAITGRKQ
jgi:hypothetical protein